MPDVDSLHRIVPAAEELDLLEQHEHDQFEEYSDRLLAELQHPDFQELATDDLLPDPPMVDEAPRWSFTHRQAVAFVTTALGGTLLQTE